MITQEILSPGSTLQAISVELLVATKLLSEKASAKVGNALSKSNLDNLSARAVTLTTTLRTFEGYNHYGINE